MTSPLTIPLLRHVLKENRMVLTAGDASYIISIPAAEHMIRSDTYAPIMDGDDQAGQVYLSKSGSTVYTDLWDRKYRFAYGYFVAMMQYDGGYVVGRVCSPRGVTA
jgi:hypothetical protein